MNVGTVTTRVEPETLTVAVELEHFTIRRADPACGIDRSDTETVVAVPQVRGRQGQLQADPGLAQLALEL